MGHLRYTRLSGNRDVGRVGRWRGSVHAHRRSGVTPSPRRHSARPADDICTISSAVGQPPARHSSTFSVSATKSLSRVRRPLPSQCTMRLLGLRRSLRLNSNTHTYRLSVAIEYQAAAMTSARMAEPFGMWSSLSGPTMTQELMLSAGVGRVAVVYGWMALRSGRAVERH